MTTYPVTTDGTMTATDATVATGPPAVLASATDGTAAGSGVKSATVDKVDTVTLQGKTQTASADTPDKGDSSTIGGRIGSVLFSYNSKGVLRIKFMDTSNTLVYQTPPVLMARMMDLMMRPDYSVSAKV